MSIKSTNISRGRFEELGIYALLIIATILSVFSNYLQREGTGISSLNIGMSLLAFAIGVLILKIRNSYIKIILFILGIIYVFILLFLNSFICFDQSSCPNRNMIQSIAVISSTIFGSSYAYLGFSNKIIRIIAASCVLILGLFSLFQTISL